jgi:hypothetical protein
MIQGNTRSQRLAFGEAHGLLWKTGFASIGITEPEGTAYSVKVEAARTAYDAMVLAHNAAKAATLNWYTKCDDMSDDASILLGKIKSYARAQADPNAVYVAAQIPAPAAPVPAGPPTDCTDLTANLNNDGSVSLAWKGTTRSGQFFSVWRKLAGESAWTQMGSVAAKAFTDTEVPEGITGGQYVVKAHRGTQTSFGCEPVGIIFGTVPLAA